MPEFVAGPTAIMKWVYSGGTVNLQADYRTFDWNPSTAYTETTAGQDTQVGRLPTIKDATASITLVMQSGTAGTAVQTSLQSQTAGTLIFQPEGTATNKRIITFPAYCDGAVLKFPYATVAEISCGFTGSSVLGNYTDTVN